MRSACFILAVISFLPVLRAQDETTKPSESDIVSLINNLSDPDSAIRKKAAEKLLDIGMPARPAILKAAHSDDPEQRAQAARILRRLPWWTSHDSRDVRAVLERYGETSDVNRMTILRRLDDLNASSTILRLFAEEPSDTVRWIIVEILLGQSDDSVFATFRKQAPDPNDAPALVMTGFAWRDRDRAKCNSFFQQALNVEAIRPTNDFDGILELPVEYLVNDAIESLDFDRAAELLRRQVPRELSTRRTFGRSVLVVVPMLVRLIALHEYVGPLDHFGWDAQTWSIAPDSPPLTGALAANLAQLGFDPPTPTELTRNFNAFQHYAAASFLWVQCSMPDAAEIELRNALTQLKPPQHPYRATLLAFLAELTAARDDDRETVKLLTSAFDVKGGRPFEPLPGSREPFPDHRSEDDLRAELHFRVARIAQADGNVAKADREVEQLMEFAPSNIDSVIKMVNWLKETNRTAQGKKLFTRFYDAAVSHINESPGHPTLQNDLAWACARCDENLDKATEFAEAAVKDAPSIPAFLDTLAEVKYRTGKKDEAIKLETRALEMTPDAKFMKEQVARFKAGKQ